MQPYSRAANLLRHYLQVCSQAAFPTPESRASIRDAVHNQAFDLSNDCQSDSFEQWVRGLKLPALVERVPEYARLLAQVRDASSNLDTKLSASQVTQLDDRDFETLVKLLTESVTALLKQWADAQVLLTVEIKDRLDGLHKDLATHLGAPKVD